MTVMKTAESFQATYVATSVPKTVSLLKENQDDLRQEFQESNLHCLQSRICIACEQAFGRAGNQEEGKAKRPLSPPFPSPSLLFFSPNREPVHRLEFVFSDCLLQETVIIGNCNKLCYVESILETLCGMLTMQ